MRIGYRRAIYLATLALAGCVSTPQGLVKDEASPVISGQIVRASQGGRLVLETAERRFMGDFKVERVQNWQELKDRYQSSPKRWDAIFSGLDATHVINKVTARLIAADGVSMECKLAWRNAGNPAGTCKDNSGTSFNVRFAS